MNGSKMYLEGDTYRERIPKPIKAIIIVFHVLAIFLLVGALIYSINIGILSEPSTLRPIWFTSVAIIFYIVASATLDAGFNRYKDKALIATVVMLWFSIIFCGLNFIPHVNPYIYDYIIIPAIVAIVGAGLMFIEILFVFVALGCATERKRKYLYEQRLRERKEQPKDFVPDSLKAATIVFFSLALLLVLATMIMLFVSNVNAKVIVYEKVGYYGYNVYDHRVFDFYNDSFSGIACLGALLATLTGLAIYYVGCKRNNNVMGITLLPMVAAMLIMGFISIRKSMYGGFEYGRYYYSIDVYEGPEFISIMGYISAGLLFLTYIFVVISLCVATREQKKLGKSGAVKQMTVVQGFDYNRQNWWD